MAVSIPVYLPTLLHASVGGAKEISIEAKTLVGAIDALKRDYPSLWMHLYESDGTQRQHVLLFYNDENTRYLDTLDLDLSPGDTLTITQAVSGG